MLVDNGPVRRCLSQAARHREAALAALTLSVLRLRSLGGAALYEVHIDGLRLDVLLLVARRDFAD